MNREKRFEQKINAKRKIIRRIYEDLNQYERVGGFWYAGEFHENHRNRLKTYWNSRNKPTNFSQNPGWWDHEFSTIPSRRASNRQLNMILRGISPDLIVWPDYKKPKLYYW